MKTSVDIGIKGLKTVKYNFIIFCIASEKSKPFNKWLTVPLTVIVKDPQVPAMGFCCE
jgi:hypothetical protein